MCLLLPSSVADKSDEWWVMLSWCIVREIRPIASSLAPHVRRFAVCSFQRRVGGESTKPFCLRALYIIIIIILFYKFFVGIILPKCYVVLYRYWWQKRRVETDWPTKCKNWLIKVIADQVLEAQEEVNIMKTQWKHNININYVNIMWT